MEKAEVLCELNQKYLYAGEQLQLASETFGQESEQFHQWMRELEWLEELLYLLHKEGEQERQQEVQRVTVNSGLLTSTSSASNAGSYYTLRVTSNTTTTV